MIINRIKFVILFASLSLSFAADPIFKTCSAVDFCSNLRKRTPQQLYTAEECECGAIAEIDLTTDDGTKLLLYIEALENDKLRIKIKEAESTRYELQDVLVEKPKVIDFESMSGSSDSVTLNVGTNKVVVNYSPLSIEIYKDDILSIVIPGDRLILNQMDFAFAVKFPAAYQLYGIHEHAASLALANTVDTDPFRLRNLDVPAYDIQSPAALYGAIPVLYGHGPNQTSGIFLHNAAEQWYDIANSENGSEAYVMVEAGTLDLFILLGPSIVDVIRQYTELTGTAHLPQLWALGYHQCRWNYDSQEDVKDVVANFNNYNFPLDVIWLDIEYTDGKKYFTWNPTNFSDPVEMQNNISATHKRLITIIDPHIKAETGYNVYDGALSEDLFVKNNDGSVFKGDCWPGESSYMDFLNPKARDYYASYYSYDKFPDTTPVLSGIWNDMNEPSVFIDEIEKTLPGDALHFNNVSHRNIHNIYGFLHTMSTHQGLINRDNGTVRPFVLTRSHFAGSQRYTAIWTGDNVAGWDYMAISYAECLNANLLGIVFCGADVGGFIGDPSEEMLQRWYQAGVWLPFYRAHAELGTKRREPYLFSEDVQKVIRNAIQLRYKHIPVWYTLFYNHTRTGDPIIRPIFYHYPTEVDAYKIDTQLLVGSDILVAPVTESEAKSVDVYFPGGNRTKWLSIYDNTVVSGTGKKTIPVTLDSIPVYYRSGSIIVTKATPRLSTAEMAIDGHTLYVNLGEDKMAYGSIYLDDNESFDYQTKKEYSFFKIVANNTRLSISNIDEDSTSNFDFVIENMIINDYSDETSQDGIGTYSQKVYTKDAEGRLLKDITKDKFNRNRFEIVL